VHDSNAVVHALYEGEAVAAVAAAFPGTAVDGRIDRAKLAAQLVGDAAAIKRLEAIVHPLVRAATQRFLDAQAAKGARVVVLDIPLLFETGGERRVDAVVVVSAPPEVQRARVLGRSGMTAERLDTLLARQMSDAEKRARAHFVVDSSRSFDSARTQVHGILRAVAALPGGRIG
jgi:dephospho-CoA kinase